jgi:DNA repair exonuclease SbcCD ATPase subunit
MKERAYADMQRAKREEARYREKIALNEKKILEAQEEMEQARKEIEEAKEIQDKMKIAMDKSQAELEKAQRERDRVVDLRKQAMIEKNGVNEDMKKLEAKLENMKKTERTALKELTRAESELRDVRERAKVAFEKNGTATKEYQKIIDEHRDSLRKISKKLDEIEVEVEVDKAFNEKKERKEVALERSRNLASVSSGKFAKITSPACNIRTFPAANSKIIGSYKQGRKVHVKIHDKAWYTTVFNGEKVFMGAGCFE